MYTLAFRAAIAAASAVAVATPAGAVVYVLTVSGTTATNYQMTTDANGVETRDDFAAGSAFSARIRFDTDRMPANDPAAGEDFRFEGSPVFTATVTFRGRGVPAFGGMSLGASLVGAYGPDGYFDLADDRLIREDAAVSENVSLNLSGFGGLRALAGGAFPDLASAPSIGFTLGGTRLDRVTGEAVSGFADGTITSATLAAVPEPAGWATMALGFGLLGAALRRRRTPAHA